MNGELHVVAFNVPWPADYGGVMDVYYRLRALSEAGVGVHLHCFTYGRARAKELESLCVEVDYYRRDMSWWLQFGKRPFIVSSRDNAELRRRLQQDGLPLLLEGVHCCSLLEPGVLDARRQIAVRAHNVEAEYYGRLAASERQLPKRIYLSLESWKLRRYEDILRRAAAVFTVSDADREHFEAAGCRQVSTVVCGHPNRGVGMLPGRGDYAVFHGDLSVGDNERAAMELIDGVFGGTEYRLVVAGHAPSAALRRTADRQPNVTLVADPTDEEMERLVAEAQVNILITHQATGLKVKLLNSLFKGRHCLVNSAMVAGTGLAELCRVADTREEMRQAVRELMEQAMGEELLAMRERRMRPYVTSNAIQPILNWLSKAEG